MAWGAKIISFLYAAHNPTQANPGVHPTLYTTHLILPVLGGIGGVASGGQSPPAAGGHGSEHLFIVVVQILCELAASS